jgi:Fur family ferric uptake transcriptional regulator
MAKKQLTELLRQEGLSITSPRLNVLAVLDQSDGPLSVENIVEFSTIQIPLSTVYRVVADLLDARIVSTFSSPDKKLLVELTRSTSGHHHHLYCQSCEKVFDIDLDKKIERLIENVIKDVSASHGMRVYDHSFEIYGTCDRGGHHLKSDQA